MNSHEIDKIDLGATFCIKFDVMKAMALYAKNNQAGCRLASTR